MNPFFFAAAGDIHGHHALLIQRLSQVTSGLDAPLAFILQVGDFEPIRDESDLAKMPPHTNRRGIGDFHHVLNGDLRYPADVLFIGGNHEPYIWLQSMPDGGEVAPGIHYMGRANVVTQRDLRIAGLGGIHSPKRYELDIPEAWPERKVTVKEPTYFRKSDVARLLTEPPVDILLTHEWPQGLFGYFGNRYAHDLMYALRPRLHLAGHMHTAKRKRVTYSDGTETLVIGLNHVGCGAGDVLLFRSDGTSIHEISS